MEEGQVRGKSFKRVGNGKNRAGVTLFNISQPEKGQKIRSPFSPPSLRYLIAVSGLPGFKINGTIFVVNGKRDSGAKFTSSKFCEQTGLPMLEW